MPNRRGRGRAEADQVSEPSTDYPAGSGVMSVDVGVRRPGNPRLEAKRACPGRDRVTMPGCGGLLPGAAQACWAGGHAV